MHTLELPALRDVLAGSVGLFNNYNLCHMKTIAWDEIISGNFLFFIFCLIFAPIKSIEIFIIYIKL